MTSKSEVDISGVKDNEVSTEPTKGSILDIYRVLLRVFYNNYKVIMKSYFKTKTKIHFLNKFMF